MSCRTNEQCRASRRCPLPAANLCNGQVVQQEELSSEVQMRKKSAVKKSAVKKSAVKKSAVKKSAVKY